MVSARRTGISPRGGLLSKTPFYDLASEVVMAIARDANVALDKIDGLLLGNALAAGGNPARLVALAVGLPHRASAYSIDTQCCSGLDAIAIAADRIRAGAADILLAGGAESASQAPQRYKRRSLRTPSEREKKCESAATDSHSETTSEVSLKWMPYDEADFTPWSEIEPTMIQSARALSDRFADLSAEYAWAVRSHQRARSADHPERIMAAKSEHARDSHTRDITVRHCQRAACHPAHNPATMAPLADGAAMSLLMSERALHEWYVRLERSEGTGAWQLGSDASFEIKLEGQNASVTKPSRIACEVFSSCQVGADPFTPGLATAALKDWLDKLRAECGEPDCIELMESFAVQAILNIRDLGLDADRVNIRGGLLAMGHPIGASGAVLAARLFHTLGPSEWGVSLIPAAGGVASGLALRRIVGL